MRLIIGIAVAFVGPWIFSWVGHEVPKGSIYEFTALLSALFCLFGGAAIAATSKKVIL